MREAAVRQQVDGLLLPLLGSPRDEREAPRDDGDASSAIGSDEPMSDYVRWFEHHEQRSREFDRREREQFNEEPFRGHDPLCMWNGEPVQVESDQGRERQERGHLPLPGLACLGCQLVHLREDAVEGDEELRSLARGALYELLNVVQAHLHEVEEYGVQR
jgi:hypothetical protein